ncbi:MAG: hypothetical protein AAFQ94_18555 [Bacteroidota bacterium]
MYNLLAKVGNDANGTIIRKFEVIAFFAKASKAKGEPDNLPGETILHCKP